MLSGKQSNLEILLLQTTSTVLSYVAYRIALPSTTMNDLQGYLVIADLSNAAARTAAQHVTTAAYARSVCGEFD